jgi:hypothetical protein
MANKLPPAYGVTTTTMTTTSSSSSISYSYTPYPTGVPTCPQGNGTMRTARHTKFTANQTLLRDPIAIRMSLVSKLALQLVMHISNCGAATFSGQTGAKGVVDGICYLKTTGSTVTSLSTGVFFLQSSKPTMPIPTSSSMATPPGYGVVSTTSMSASPDTSSSSFGITQTTTTTSTTQTTTTATSSSSYVSRYLIIPWPTPCDFGDPDGYPEDDS